MNPNAYVLALTLGVFVGNMLVYRLGYALSWETSTVQSLLAAGVAAALVTLVYAAGVKLANWMMR